MTIFELLQKNGGAKLADAAWGQTVLDLVNLQLSEDKVVTNQITGRATLELIFGMDVRPRSTLLQVDIPLSDDDPQNVTPATTRKKVMLGVSVCMFVAMVIVIGGYIALTQRAGGTVDQGTMDKLLGMLGQVFTALLGQTQ